MTAVNVVQGTVLVTGGSRGIGRATAERAALAGWNVVISYRADTDAADTVVQACREYGVRADAVRADVGREDDVVALFAWIDEHAGRLAGLVNNAGIVPTLGTVAEMTGERISAVLDVNVRGPLLCAREAVRRMSTAYGGNGGVIVNVSSRAAVRGGANDYVDYAASKGALDTMTVGLSAEVIRDGIRVVGVRPGLIDTTIHATGRLERMTPTLPMGRPGTADEVAAAIVWLLSSDASYVAGATLDVGGGV